MQQRELQAQLQSAQAQLSSMETKLGQRAAHYQSLYAELLDKASHTAALEKEVRLMFVGFGRIFLPIGVLSIVKRNSVYV